MLPSLRLKGCLHPILAHCGSPNDLPRPPLPLLLSVFALRREAKDRISEGSCTSLLEGSPFQGPTGNRLLFISSSSENAPSWTFRASRNGGPAFWYSKGTKLSIPGDSVSGHFLSRTFFPVRSLSPSRCHRRSWILWTRRRQDWACCGKLDF